MVSLMNALGSMGQGIATFAGQAGLEAQKAQLQQQNTVLAANLAHTSAMSEQAQQQAAQKEVVGMQTASAQTVAITDANARVAAAKEEAGGMVNAAQITSAVSRQNNEALITAQKPEWNAQAAQTSAAAKLTGTQADENARIWDLTHTIATESAKPADQQDQGKIASANAERSAIIMGDPSMMKTMQDSLATSVRALAQEANGADAAVARVLAQRAQINMGDPAVAQEQKTEEQQLQSQRDAVYDRLNRAVLMQQQYSPQAAARGAPPPAAGAKPPPATQFLPQPAAGVPPVPPTPAPRAGLANAPVPPPPVFYGNP